MDTPTILFDSLQEYTEKRRLMRWPIVVSREDEEGMISVVEFGIWQQNHWGERENLTSVEGGRYDHHLLTIDKVSSQYPHG